MIVRFRWQRNLQMSAMKACFQIAECSFSSAKIASFRHLANIKSHSFFGNVSANVSKICKRLK